MRNKDNIRAICYRCFGQTAKMFGIEEDKGTPLVNKKPCFLCGKACHIEYDTSAYNNLKSK